MSIEARERIGRRSIKRVSLVVAALNEGKNIQKIIDSVALQKRPEGLEISMVVSDNGSYDKETLTEYSRLLSTQQPIDITIIQGSKTGHLGATREYGVKAAVDLFNKDHDNSSKSHVIVGLDADGPIDPKHDFFTALVECFEKNPNAAMAYGPLPFAVTKYDTLQWTSRFARPIFKTFFLKRHFGRNRRSGMISEFLHKPRELFHGGCQVFTQEAYEKLAERFGSAFNLQDSTAEEATFSMRAQNIFESDQFIYDKRIVAPFSLRELEGEGGKLSLGKGVKKAFSLIASGSEHISYRLTSVLEGKSPQEQAEFMEELGNLSYRSAVNSFIRLQEEEMFGLRQLEHVLSYVNKRKANRLKRLGFDIREGVSPITQHILYAFINQAPDDLKLFSHEYISFYVNRFQAKYLEKHEYATVKSFIDPQTNQEVYALIGKKSIPQAVVYTIFDSLKIS